MHYLGEIQRIAAANRGVVTTELAFAAGLGRKHLYRAVEWGILERAGPATFCLPFGNGPLKAIACAVRSAGPRAFAWRRSVLVLHGLLEHPGIIDVATAYPYQTQSPHAVASRLRIDQSDLVVCQTIPATRIQRALFDSAGVLSLPRTEQVVDKALRFGLLEPSMLVEDLQCRCGRGRAGSTKVRRLLRSIESQRATRSELEVEMRHLLRKGGFDFETAYRLNWDPPIELDFAIVALKIAIEVDGDLWHKTPADRRADSRRQNRLTKGAWLVLRYTAYDIRRKPDYVLQEVRDTVLTRTES